MLKINKQPLRFAEWDIIVRELETGVFTIVSIQRVSNVGVDSTRLTTKTKLHVKP